MLYGRAAERAEIDQLMRRAYDGHSGALVIVGDAGIGKTALLDTAAGAAQGMRILRGTGIESEAELPFSFLQLLLRSDLARLDALPAIQRDALQAAFGQRSSTGDDRFLVGQAVLTLLADLADNSPLLCTIDDVQWIDRASLDALLFAARRLEAERILLLLAGRGAAGAPWDLPVLRPTKLGHVDAMSLVEARAPALSEQVLSWVIDEADGNPLALLELPRLLSPAQRSSALRVHSFAPRTGQDISRVQQWLADEFTALPERTRDLVLVAAADDTGALALILAAAERFGASFDDLGPAEFAGFVTLDSTGLRFRHPLCRAAVYGSASTVQRIAVHRALADVHSDPVDADRRAWHLAAASTTPDEDVAEELEQAARRAAQRGGRVAMAAAYERAAQLSPDGDRRGRRLTLAAVAAADGGLNEKAGQLVTDALPLTSDPLQNATLARIQAGVVQAEGRTEIAGDILLAAARQLDPESTETVSRLLFGALSNALLISDRARIEAITTTIRTMGLAARREKNELARAALGIADIAAGRPSSGVPLLREVLDKVRAYPKIIGLRERAGVSLNTLTGDLNASHQLAAALEHDCRTRGAIGILPDALLLLSKSQLLLGRHREAVGNASEGLRVARDTGQRHTVSQLTTVLAYVAAVEGDAVRCRDLVSTIHDDTPDTKDHWTRGLLGLLELGAGGYESAFEQLSPIVDSAALPTLIDLPLLVEAAVAVGNVACARATYDRFAAWAEATGQPWPLSVMRRCQALLATVNGLPSEVESNFTQSVALQEQVSHPFDRARTRLLYGEWLRRQRRTKDARTELRTALELFDRLKARPWSQRARSELRAAGETAAAVSVRNDPLGPLTPQEVQVVRLAARGLSNRAIGSRLFVSPRTVGYHLYKAYPKLGVTSRAQLSQLIPSEGDS